MRHALLPRTAVCTRGQNASIGDLEVPGILKIRGLPT
jgi:hypothetical protein